MRILFTGGVGAFGKAVFRYLQAQNTIWTPAIEDLDITLPLAWRRAFDTFQPDVVFHAAGFRMVERAESERDRCWYYNVEATKLGLAEAKQAHIRFVYLSTDLVFDGTQAEDSGGYDVNDRPGPLNYFGFTKFTAELLVREYDLGAVIRGSYVVDSAPHAAALADHWTSKDFLSVLAPEFAMAVQTPFTGVVHIGTPRKTMLELVRRVNPDVESLYRKYAPVLIPCDTTLNTNSWDFAKKSWQKIHRGDHHAN